ncbi:unnamed protein product (macronuclear) [Paramecium tetraurelia]|uniref:Uncharacterized protein n=1 Tax=Paramecium tetraurelia TaxID=5888 RepID=A0DF82_PARTE|nr:uncharacterized protein GSPATT00016512001 [Paramecium tetraurelia]CAK81699.1 unnamed protein product [Paramecium tetraurelia]|eukprot:XP_001449096.1 hypothetical protein (macronuclear) [Paramecium tetraurelia strain d4-2]
MDNRLERNVNKLIDRYKKTTQQIDQIMQYEPTPQQPATYYTGRSRPSRIKDDDEDSSKERRRQSGSLEQISRLRDTLNAKELQEKEKYERIRILNQELKITLKDYMNINKELENKLQIKEKQIKALESENRLFQDQLNRGDYITKEVKVKVDSQEKYLEELQQQNHVLRQKLQVKKQKLASLRDQLKQGETVFEQQGQSFGKELERVQQLCEEFSNEIKNQEQQNRGLEVELEQSKNDLAHKMSRLDILNNYDQQQQIEGLNQQLNYLKSQLDQANEKQEVTQVQLAKAEKNQQRLLQNQEVEIEKRLSQQSNLLEKKKQKIIEQKALIDNLHTRIQDFQRLLENEEKNSIVYQKDLKQIQDINSEMNTLIENLQVKLVSAENKIQDLTQELSDQKSVLQQKKLKAEELELMTRQDFRTIEQFKHQVLSLQEQLRMFQQQCRDLENMLQLRQHENDLTMDEIEIKIDHLVKSLSSSKEEIIQFKTRENEYKQKIKHQDEEIIKLTQKSSKYKQQIEQSQYTVKQIEEKVKIYENERSVKQKQDFQIKQDQVTTQNKLRVLDDIHSLVKMHKRI